MLNDHNTMNKESSHAFTSMAQSNDTDILQVNKYIENFDFASAKAILENKLKKEPENVEVIDILSEVYFNLDEIDNTIRVR